MINCRILPVAVRIVLVLLPVFAACSERRISLIDTPDTGSEISTESTGNETDSDSETTTTNETETENATGTCELNSAQIRLTEIELGQPVISNEEEAELLPLAISPIPAGGSRIAWMGSDNAVHVARLSSDDQLVGTPLAFPAHDFQDLHATADGGVILLTRDAVGGGTLNCGDPANLCTVSDPPQACHNMFLVRFTDSGEQWATKLTTSSDLLPPYSTGPAGASTTMIWWYAHHGRIASNGSTFAAIFGSAISVSNNTCINIYQGDRMQIVNADGTLADGGFGWGCSPSGYERVVWNGTAHAYVSFCKSEVSNGIGGSDGVFAFAPDKSVIRNVDPWYANLGEIVPASDGGYWTAISDIRQGESERTAGMALIHLLHFTSEAVDIDWTIGEDNPLNLRSPHLSPLGNDHLLLMFEGSPSPGEMAAATDRTVYLQLRRADDGSAIGEPWMVPELTGHRYQALRAFPDGSAAFPTKGNTSTSIRIMRVLPCAQ